MKRNPIRKVSQLVIVTIISASFMMSCDTAPKGDTAVVGEAAKVSEAVGITMNIDTAASLVNFTGYGVGKNHPGHFKVSSGSIAAKGSEVTGGTFTININSMTMHESGDAITGKLRPHLLSPDFFDAVNFGSASFEITAVEPYTASASDSSVVACANKKVSGNLKLKDVTKNISFPAKIDVTDGTVSALANFDIDRTAWGMSYGSEKSLGDKAISPTVNIALDIKAKK